MTVYVVARARSVISQLLPPSTVETMALSERKISLRLNSVLRFSEITLFVQIFLCVRVDGNHYIANIYIGNVEVILLCDSVLLAGIGD